MTETGSGTPRHITQRMHARKRAAERYGIDLDSSEYHWLCHKLADQEEKPSPDCVRLWRQTDRLTHWAIWYLGEWIPIVFDSELRTIVTFLPSSHIRPHRNKLPW